MDKRKLRKLGMKAKGKSHCLFEGGREWRDWVRLITASQGRAGQPAAKPAMGQVTAL